MLNAWDYAADYTVRIRATLPALLACQRLTQLIRQGLLHVEGDTHSMYSKFAMLLDMAEFDTVDLLVPWIGGYCC
ncbi:MAG: hypothetical protein ACTXOO_01615 [Sodalis sp. (in: enterobacteria)]